MVINPSNLLLLSDKNIIKHATSRRGQQILKNPNFPSNVYEATVAGGSQKHHNILKHSCDEDDELLRRGDPKRFKREKTKPTAGEQNVKFNKSGDHALIGGNRTKLNSTKKDRLQDLLLDKEKEKVAKKKIGFGKADGGTSEVMQKIERLLPKLGKFMNAPENSKKPNEEPKIIKPTNLKQKKNSNDIKDSHKESKRTSSIYNYESCQLIKNTLHKILMEQNDGPKAEGLLKNKSLKKTTSKSDAGKQSNSSQKKKVHFNFNDVPNNLSFVSSGVLGEKLEEMVVPQNDSNAPEMDSKNRKFSETQPVSILSNGGTNQQILRTPSSLNVEGAKKSKRNTPRGLHTISQNNKHIFSAPRETSDFAIGKKDSTRAKEMSAIKAMIEKRLKKYKKKKEEQQETSKENEKTQEILAANGDENMETSELANDQNLQSAADTFTKEERELLKKILSEYANNIPKWKGKTTEDREQRPSSAVITSLYEKLSNKIVKVDKMIQSDPLPVKLSEQTIDDKKERDKMMEINRKTFEDMENNMKVVKIIGKQQDGKKGPLKEQRPQENEQKAMDTIKIDCELILKKRSMEELLFAEANNCNKFQNVCSPCHNNKFLPMKVNDLSAKLTALASHEKLTKKICNLAQANDQENAPKTTIPENTNKDSVPTIMKDLMELGKKMYFDLYLMDMEKAMQSENVKILMKNNLQKDTNTGDIKPAALCNPKTSTLKKLVTSPVNTQHKNITNVSKDAYSILKMQEKFKVNDSDLPEMSSVTNIFDVVAKQKPLLKNVSFEPIVHDDEEEQSKNFPLRHKSQSNKKSSDYNLKPCKSMLINTNKKVNYYNLNNTYNNNQLKFLKTNPFAMPEALRKKNSQATMLLENTANNRNLPKFKTDVHNMVQKFNYQPKMPEVKEKKLEDNLSLDTEQPVNENNILKTKGGVQIAELEEKDVEEAVDLEISAAQTQQKTKEIEEEALEENEIEIKPVIPVADDSNKMLVKSTALKNVAQEALAEVECLTLVPSEKNVLITAIGGTKEETENLEKYLREPWGTNVFNLKPGYCRRHVNFSPLPTGTIWNQEPRMKLAICYQKNKQSAPKKYKYETKEVLSSTGRKIRVTYLVEE